MSQSYQHFNISHPPSFDDRQFLLFFSPLFKNTQKHCENDLKQMKIKCLNQKEWRAGLTAKPQFKTRPYVKVYWTQSAVLYSLITT